MGKKILAWVKQNLVVVISMVVTVIGIGVMLFFSFGWNAKIKKTLMGDVQQAVSQLGNTTVTYEVPPVVPGAPAWQSKQRPNSAANEVVVAEIKRIAAESERIRDVALERNAKKKVLVEKLFPAPENESARVRLLTQLVKARTEAHEALLKSVGAGMPPTAEAIVDQIERVRAREERDRLGSRVDQKLTEEELTEIRAKLSRFRVEKYTESANQLTFYADMSVFKSVPAWKEGDLPSLELAWDWQQIYWAHEDILAALVKANTAGSGLRQRLPQGVVKRVVSISLAPAPYLPKEGAPAASAEPGAEGAAPPPADPSAEIPKDYTRSFTGRPATSGLYDVREVELVVLADANRLPKLLNAINTTNFMGVVDMDLKAVDPYEDLKQGFVYGNDALVEVRLVIETVWMRSWMKGWMPKGVRTALGIPDDPPPAEGAADPNAEQPADGAGGST